MQATVTGYSFSPDGTRVAVTYGDFGGRPDDNYPSVAVLYDTATGQVTASSIMLIPVALIEDRPWALPWPSMGTVAALAGLALLATALAYIIYFLNA